MLDRLEKQFLNQEGDTNEAILWSLGENMTHQYYLDQLNHIRPTSHMMSDLLMVVLILMFWQGGMYVLRAKGYLWNYQQKWIDD